MRKCQYFMCYRSNHDIYSSAGRFDRATGDYMRSGTDFGDHRLDFRPCGGRVYQLTLDIRPTRVKLQRMRQAMVHRKITNEATTTCAFPTISLHTTSGVFSLSHRWRPHAMTNIQMDFELLEWHLKINHMKINWFACICIIFAEMHATLVLSNRFYSFHLYRRIGSLINRTSQSSD